MTIRGPSEALAGDSIQASAQFEPKCPAEAWAESQRQDQESPVLWVTLASLQVLGGVDEFEPVSGVGDMYHAQEAGGELIISGGNGAVDFQTAEHALNAVTLLVERPVMFDFHPAV